jgi:hypothetical protein
MFLFIGPAMVVALLGDPNTEPANLTEQEREPKS